MSRDVPNKPSNLRRYFSKLNQSITSVTRATKLAWFILIFGSIITLLILLQVLKFNREESRKIFGLRTHEITSRVRENLNSYEQILLGGTGFLQTTNILERGIWRDYVQDIRLEENWPYIQGLGFIAEVSSNEKSEHIASIRAEGFPDYTIKPTGDREAYSAVILIEPFNQSNQRLFGVDLLANENTRVAMINARDTGLASRSETVDRFDETGMSSRQEFYSFIPLYKKGMPTVDGESRRAAFMGWVYSSFILSDLLEFLLNEVESDINFEIFDSEPLITEEKNTFNTAASLTSGSLTQSTTINFQGRNWTIRYSTSLTASGSLNRYIVWIIGLGGAIVNLLLFAIIRTISSLRSRAEEIAKEKTDNLESEILKTKLAHQKMREANLELAFQKESLDEHAIVSIADIKGNITYVNDKFCEISGYSREELVGQNHRILKSDGHSDDLYRDLWRTIANGKPWSGEIKNFTKDGSSYWVLSTIVPFLDEGGKPIKYVSIRTDITAHKAAESEIRKFKTTLDLLKDSVRMFDPVTLKYTYGNEVARKAGGYTDEELLNLTVADVNEDFIEDEFRERTRALITGEQDSTTFGILRKDQDGNPLHLDVSLQYIQPDDEPPRFVSIARDTTERFIAEKAKEEFISIVSHELRTPLTSIKGALGLVQSGSFGTMPDGLQKMLQIANNNTDRLIVLINDILDMEKLGSGKMSFAMDNVNLRELITEEIEANKNYAQQYDVTFIAIESVDDLNVWGDRGRLSQVLTNLLSNAAKFSTEQGARVEISLVRDGDNVRVSVKDYGLGIPDSAKETIFDKFTQVDSTDQRNSEGSGLGLNIAKMIIEAHGGQIWFENNEDAGTTFYFEMPEFQHLEQDAIGIISSESNRGKILICEDEPDIALILEAHLHAEGFKTATVGTAREAKEALARGHFDGMTLDIGLPDQNGISLLHELRSLPKTENLPVVVVSASPPAYENKLEGTAVEIVDWLQKPVDASVVIERMKSVMSLRKNDEFRILHIEDDDSTRHVISALIGDAAEIIGAKSFREAKKYLQRECYNLIILDLILPDGNGLELLPFCNAYPQNSTPVIVFSIDDVSAKIASEVHAVLIKSRANNTEILEVISSFIHQDDD